MISIIIPTANREKDLVDVLESIVLCVRNYSCAYEVLVINNGLKESLIDIEKLFNNRISSFRIIFEKNKGLHFARNRGVKESQGDIIAFLDDDVILNKDWLKNIESIFQDPLTGLCTGNNLPLFIDCEIESWFYEYWKPSSLRKSRYFWPLSVSRNENKNETVIENNLVWGCNFIIRKSILQKSKGFHPDGLPSDFRFYRGDGESYVAEFSKSIGYKAIHSPKLFVWHKVHSNRTTLDYINKRAYNEGITQGYLSKRNETFYNRSINSNFIFRIVQSIYKVVKLPFLSKNQKLIEKTLSNGILKGKKDFLDEYYSNPDLVAWVNKSSYFEE